MNMNDPVQNLWLGKMQTEIGVYVSNGLLAEAKVEFLQHNLTKALAENEGLKTQVEDMGKTNVALREEVARLTELLKPKLRAPRVKADG